MKRKKISRILGVVLTLALLSSLAIVPAPVSAGTQSWSTFATPSATGLVLDPGNTWTGPFAQASNGDIYAASNVGGLGFAAVSLVKSTDDGRTWTNTGLAPAYGGWSPTITDIVTSSIDAQTVYVTDGYDIYKTTDGGTNWVPLSNLFTSVPGANGLITSIDVGYIGTAPYIFASTSTFGWPGGGAYVCEEAVWGMPWSDLLLDTDRPLPAGNPWGWGTDVNFIMVDPVNFATTQMVMAVATDYNVANSGVPGTVITTKYGGAQWDTTVNDVVLPGINNPLMTASLWLPDNFRSSLLSGNMQLFASVADLSGAQGDVFLANFAAPAVANTAAFDLNVRGGVTQTQITGLDGVGPAGSATLLASGYDPAVPNVPVTYRSTPGGFTWLANAKGPTGGASPLWGTALSSVLVLNSTDALVGTHGPDAGVSHTNDFGRIWNTISLVNDPTSYAIDDLETGSFFMTTYSGPNESVWRHDGTNWERVFSTSIYPGPIGPLYLIEQSPAGDAVFLAVTGGVNIWRSSDDGDTWTLQANNIQSTGPGTGTISSLAVIDANTLVVGDGTNLNTVYTTATNGGYWFTRTANVGGVTSLDYDSATGHVLAGGVAAGVATVARSTNAANVGTMTFTATAAVPFATATNVIAIFGDNYASTSTIFATGTDTGDGDAGVYSYDYSAAAPAWARIDGSGPTADVAIGTGLVAAPADTAVSGAEMVYASDGTAGEGVSRIRQPFTVSEQMADAPSTFGFLGVGASNLWYEAGSNVLYAIDTTGWVIRTYTDTLNVSGTGVTVSAVTTGTATVSWDALANATGYFVAVNTTAQTNFYTAGSNPGITGVGNVTGTTTNIGGLANNTIYNVSVWARLPVSSYLFDSATASLITLETVATPTNQVPVNGMQNASVLPSFVWSAVSNAEFYEFELSTDPAFVTTIVTATIAAPVTAYTSTTELAYDTNHYWRVRAKSTDSLSGEVAYSTWCFSNFHTMVEPQPPVVIPPQPTPTITIEIPDFEIPPFPEIPDITIPDITLPPVEIPDIDLTIPPIELPDITLPPVEIPDITLPPVEIPDIVIPDIEIPPLEQPDVIVNLPTPTITEVSPTIETPPTPAYVWAIVGIGAVLTIAVIILIVRTRRIV